MQSKPDQKQLEKSAQACKGGRTSDPKLFQNSRNCHKGKVVLPETLISGQLKAIVLRAKCGRKSKVYRHTIPHQASKPLWSDCCLCQTAAGAGGRCCLFWVIGSAVQPAAEWFTLQIRNVIMCLNENVLCLGTGKKSSRNTGSHCFGKHRFAVICIFHQVNF